SPGLSSPNSDGVVVRRLGCAADRHRHVLRGFRQVADGNRVGRRGCRLASDRERTGAGCLRREPDGGGVLAAGDDILAKRDGVQPQLVEIPLVTVHYAGAQDASLRIPEQPCPRPGRGKRLSAKLVGTSDRKPRIRKPHTAEEQVLWVIVPNEALELAVHGGAGRSGRTLRPLGTRITLVALRTLRTRRSLRPLGAGVAFVTLGSLRTGGALWPFRPSRPLRPCRTLWPLRSLRTGISF